VFLGLTLERPVNVQYDADTGSVTFHTPFNTALCVRMRLLSRDVWTTNELRCNHTTPDVSVQPDGISLVQLTPADIDSVDVVQVSFCVEGRSDVCGPSRNATFS